MAVIGNSSTQQAFTPAVDYFSGNASTTAFTLSRPVASVAQVQVVVNNVAQNPSSAYTISSNTITFTSAPSSGTNNIYVYYTSPITDVIAPGQGTVTATSMASSTGTGAGVFQTSPTLVTPALGTPSALVLTNATGLPAAQLTGTQTIPKATLPTGSVLQVVNATNSTSYTGTSGAETALFNFSITPLYSSSKIAIYVSLATALVGSYTNFASIFRLRRGTTTAGTSIQNVRFGQYQGGGASNREIYGMVSFNGVDSPATTSAQSYCITVENIDGGSTYQINSNGITNIIFMEISA
jgi:hypothetical protein